MLFPSSLAPPAPPAALLTASPAYLLTAVPAPGPRASPAVPAQQCQLSSASPAVSAQQCPDPSARSPAEMLGWKSSATAAHQGQAVFT